MLYKFGGILLQILKILYLIMFQDNNSHLVVNLDYKLVNKEHAFMKLRHCLYVLSLSNMA